MGIHYESLDAPVRDFMVSEFKSDLANGRLFISSRLTVAGAQVWPEILQEACEQHNDVWIADVLRSNGYITPEEQRRNRNGGFGTAKVPSNAADMLAEGEFNRFYARGLCAQVLAAGETEVEVYRGKQVQNPRPESQAMIGRLVSAAALLEDLRNSVGIDTSLGLPGGPNSGLTVRRAGLPSRMP